MGSELKNVEMAAVCQYFISCVDTGCERTVDYWPSALICRHSFWANSGRVVSKEVRVLQGIPGSVNDPKLPCLCICTIGCEDAAPTAGTRPLRG